MINGILVVVNLCIGSVRSSLGANLSVLTQIADIPNGILCRSIMLRFLIMIGVLLASTYTEWIPMLVWLFRG